MTKKWIFTAVSAITLTTLAACSSNQAQPVASSQASSSAAVSSTTASSSQAATSSSQMERGKLDGTYTAKHEGEDLTLTITGMTGQLTTVEMNGEQEIENVSVDESKMTLTIGDDVKSYEIKGNQLIINDFDRELDDQVTFTKK